MKNAESADNGCPPPIRDWLTSAIEAEASDLHLVPGYPPVLRVHGELRQLNETPLDAVTIGELLARVCPSYAMGRFRSEA